MAIGVGFGRIGRFFSNRGPRRQLSLAATGREAGAGAASISLDLDSHHHHHHHHHHQRPSSSSSSTSTSSSHTYFSYSDSARGYQLDVDSEDQPLPLFEPYHDLETDEDFDPIAFAKRQNSLYRKRRLRNFLRHRCVMFLLFIGALLAASFLYKWRTEKALKARWRPDAETIAFTKNNTMGPPPAHLNITNFELPLRTKGRDVVDASGKRFKLASVNWYGASDELFVVGGLNVRHRSEIAQVIRNMGFNSVRLPYADELVTANPKVDPKLLSKNPDLIGKTALEVFEATTNALTDAGIAVIINNHITTATWCCGADPCDAGWANDHLGPICRIKQTEEDWIRNWEKIMLPHLNNPLVIGCDLRNEVRGLWGTMPWSKWAAAAENAGNRLLKMNPDWLIVVEGTESANDLSGARKRPVVLDVPNKLVYSAHVYGWSGWGSMGGRFVQRTYDSFVATMRWNWGYLLEEDIAPVWLGELGASHSPGLGSRNYWRNLFQYMKSLDADFGYWALNPRKPRRSAPESYALVKDDYKTPILDYRMKDMLELMRQ